MALDLDGAETAYVAWSTFKLLHERVEGPGAGREERGSFAASAPEYAHTEELDE